MFERKLSFTKPLYPKARAIGITEFPYYEYDLDGNVIYYEDSFRWIKQEYDSNGKLINFNYNKKETFAQGK